jgi:hypothetical protein
MCAIRNELLFDLDEKILGANSLRGNGLVEQTLDLFGDAAGKNGKLADLLEILGESVDDTVANFAEFLPAGHFK